MEENEIKLRKTNFKKNVDLLIEEKKKDPSAGRITKDKIGKEMGLCPRTLDSDNPCLETILRIADYFKVSFDWLVGWSEHRSPSNSFEPREYGLTSESVTMLQRARSSRYAGSYTDDFIGYNPPVAGKVENKYYAVFFRYTNYPYDSVPLCYYDDCNTEEERREKDISSQFDTLNYMLTDWELVELMDAYLHSIPIELADQYGDLHLFDHGDMILARIKFILDARREEKLTEFYKNYKKSNSEKRRTDIDYKLVGLNGNDLQ